MGQDTPLVEKRPIFRGGIASFLEREDVLGFVLIAPVVVLVISLVAYPFLMGLYLSFTNATVGSQNWHFVGIRNFRMLLGSPVFWSTVRNSFVFTVAAVALKFSLGLPLAMLLNRPFRGVRFIQALVMLPWVIPITLSALAWVWMFDPMYSPINWVLREIGILRRGLIWLGSPRLAMFGIILVNVWHGLPFYAMTLLAGLLAIPKELHEAAEVDGAGPFTHLFRITFPLLRRTIGILLLYSTIMTMADFKIVYILTRGGPMNSTHIFGTLAYQVGIVAGNLGEGAAISLFLFPVLVVVATTILNVLYREDLY
jgi:multiple sugar transport system permease protein